MNKKGVDCMRILNFGSCNIDTVYNVSNIVRPGETISAVSVKSFPGGKGLNQSVAIAKAGVPVYHAGCIGENDLKTLSVLKMAGVDTTNIKRVEEHTGQAFIQVDMRGQNAIIVHPGANAKITKEEIDRVINKFDAGDILLLQNEISNLFYLINVAAEKGMRIVLNPSPFDEKLREIDLTKLYCVVLNETEATEWIKTKKPYDFLTFAREKYPKLKVLLTLGKQGSRYLDNGQIYHQFAFKVPTVDTTAAGDTFTGYFVAGLFQDKETWINLKEASAAAAIAVSREGAATSIPVRKEVLEQMETLDTNINQAEQKACIESYIMNNLSDANISDVVKILNYTERTTRRIIQKHFGMSFVKLLQYKRCEKAAELLEEESLSISDIVHKVGYANENFFRKMFVQQYQVVPSEYRKNLKRREKNDE